MHKATQRLLSIIIPVLFYAVTIIFLHNQVAKTTTDGKVGESLPPAGLHNTKLKIYVYDLPYEQSLEHYLDVLGNETAPKSNCDWNINVCRENWEPYYSSMRQAGGDATLIQKFRVYPNRVKNAQDADMFVVPYPHSSICRLYTQTCFLGCSTFCSKARSTAIASDIDKMIASLKYFNETTKARHLFLLTSDTMDHQKVLTNMPLYVSLGGANYPGSTNIIIPPPNTEPDYQPSSLAKFEWTKPRNVAVFMMAGLPGHLTLRKKAFDILEKTPMLGGLPVEVHAIIGRRNFTLSAQDTWAKYRDSYFCPSIEGDRPYMKRFFDAALSGCIPVVITFPASDCNPHKSFFREGWPGYNETYPFPSSIDYTQFVVQLDNLDDMVPTLESLIENKTKITEMQLALSKAANKFVYGLGNELAVGGDAFDALLGDLESYISQLGRGSSSREQSFEFCPGCVWSYSMTCGARLQHIVSRYHENEQSVKKALMNDFSQCRTSSCNRQ